VDYDPALVAVFAPRSRHNRFVPLPHTSRSCHL